MRVNLPDDIKFVALSAIVFAIFVLSTYQA